MFYINCIYYTTAILIIGFIFYAFIKNIPYIVYRIKEKFGWLK
jgi:hypothetical protein